MLRRNDTTGGQYQLKRSSRLFIQDALHFKFRPWGNPQYVVIKIGLHLMLQRNISA